MAESNSAYSVEAPCMAVPPLRVTFVLGLPGDAFRECVRETGLLLDLKSDIREPAAEGGARGVCAGLVV